MKTRYVVLVISVFLFFQGQSIQAQSQDYRKDSLQFKMYTRLFVNEQLGVDSITVKKIFCDYCSELQTQVLNNEAIRQTQIERYNPKYKKPGEHRLALIVRFSKADFRKLIDDNE